MRTFCRNVATINSLEEFLDSIHTQLDELWRLPQNYPQNRMIDLMDIICRFLLISLFHSFTQDNNLNPFTFSPVFFFTSSVLCWCFCQRVHTHMPCTYYSVERNWILCGSAQRNWWCLGCQILACVPNIEWYYRGDWVLDTSVRLTNAIILAELLSTRVDWWAAHTENSNATLKTTTGYSSHS